MLAITKSLLVVAFVVSATSALKFSSPCPDLFHYDSSNQQNQWTGTLTLLSDADLHGVWVRLLFDGKLKKLTVQDNLLEAVSQNDSNELLIKNREILLKAGAPKQIKITVEYDGEKLPPTLAGFRLNAKMVCSVEKDALDNLFLGDLDSSNFLSQVVDSSLETFTFKDSESCGTTPLSQFPWQASVFFKDGNNRKFICEATLISPKHLILPAHCVTYRQTELSISVRQLTVYLGADNYNHKENDENVQELEISKIHIHPGYITRNLVNDLAVLQLTKAVVVGDYVRPICLNQLVKEKKENSVVGYEAKKDKFDKLGQAKINVLAQDECLKKAATLKSIVSENTLCATYTEENTPCIGSSGSSIVTLRDSKVWELKGIVTAGAALQNKHECNASSVLFFLNIKNYLKWIQSTML